jgi:anti-sigma-K factor RskA
MKYSIDPKDAFAVTMEPAGGSTSPTMPILAIAKK